MNSLFTWTLDLLHNLWVLVFVLIFGFAFVYNIIEAIEERKRKKMGN